MYFFLDEIILFPIKSLYPSFEGIALKIFSFYILLF